MLMVSMIASAQLWVGYKSDSAKVAEYREKIGLDYSMPDYSVTYNAYSCPLVTGTCPLSRRCSAMEMALSIGSAWRRMVVIRLWYLWKVNGRRRDVSL